MYSKGVSSVSAPLHSQRIKFARFIMAIIHLTSLVMIRTLDLCSLAARGSLRETGNVRSSLVIPSLENWRQRQARGPSCASLAPSPQRPPLPGAASARAAPPVPGIPNARFSQCPASPVSPSRPAPAGTPALPAGSAGAAGRGRRGRRAVGGREPGQRGPCREMGGERQRPSWAVPQRPSL